MPKSEEATKRLHTAVYRNDLESALSAIHSGADIDAPDLESQWTPLHKALYWGHVHIAAILLTNSASTTVLDRKHRTPLEVAAEDIRGQLHFSRPGGVFVWGSGANYQLGTGSTEDRAAPSRLDAFGGAAIVAVAAAKFHSAAVSGEGTLFTWGWGHGGRLGHAHFAGEGAQRLMAQIHPLPVAGLARQRVTSVAAGKHHTLACTAEGYVYAWGSNRHGRLGFTGVDSSWAPRRVGHLKHAIVAVSAANKHSAALSPTGSVYMWGDNTQGQLGYGTHGRAFHATPRVVDALRDRPIASLSLSKRHSVALTTAGEVFVWGHRQVSPTRLPVHNTRDTARSAKAVRVLAAAAVAGGGPAAKYSSSRRGSGAVAAAVRGQVHFHRDNAAVVTPTIVAVAAGGAHTSMLTSTGAVLAYRSDDVAQVVQEVQGVLGAKCVVKIAAGKTRTVALTETGEVYAWEGTTLSSEALAVERQAAATAAAEPRQPGEAQWIVPQLLQGLRRAVAVAVGEKHSVALQGFWIPKLPDTLDLGVLTNQVAPERQGSQGGESAEGSPRVRVSDEGSEALSALVRTRQQARASHGPSAAPRAIAHSTALGTSPVATSLGSLYGSSPSGSFVPREPPLAHVSVRTPSDAPLPHSFMESIGGRSRHVAFQSPRAASPHRGPALDGLPAPFPGGLDSDRGPGDADDDLFGMECDDVRSSAPPLRPAATRRSRVMRLFDMAQIAAAHIVDMRNVLPVLHFAHFAQAHLLQDICTQVVINNIDGVIAEPAARAVLQQLVTDCPELLASIEAASKRRFLPALPGPAAATGAAVMQACGIVSTPRVSSGGEVIDADLTLLQSFAASPPAQDALPPLPEEPAAAGAERTAAEVAASRRPTAGSLAVVMPRRSDRPAAGPDAMRRQALASLHPDDAASGSRAFKTHEDERSERVMSKLAGHVRRRLQQIRRLEVQAAAGSQLDRQQRAKMLQRSGYEAARAALDRGDDAQVVQEQLDRLREDLQAAGQALPPGAASADDGASPKPIDALRATHSEPAGVEAPVICSSPLESCALGVHSMQPGAHATPAAASSAQVHTAEASPETVTGFAAPQPPAAEAAAPAAKAPSVRRGQLSAFLAGAIDRPPPARLPPLDPPALSAGRAGTDRGHSMPGGSGGRAWGSASLPAQTSTSLASLLGHASRSLVVPRNDSDGRSLVVPAPAAGAPKSAKARGVKLSLAEFHAKPQPPPETPVPERSSLSSGVAWGIRKSGGGAAAPAEPQMTPPSLSAIMSDEGSRRRSDRGADVGAGASSSGGGAARRLVPERGSAGAAWQRADISALRRAVIDEGLFEQASRLPDIRPTGAEGAWGREKTRVTRIEDILSEQTARALQEIQEDATAEGIGGSEEAGAAAVSGEGGQGRGQGRGGQRRQGRGGRGRQQKKSAAGGDSAAQPRRSKEQGGAAGQERKGGGGEGGDGKRVAARDGGGRRGGRRQGRGRGQGPPEQGAEGAGRAAGRCAGGEDGTLRSTPAVSGTSA
eukprot:jgi/Ulvmu1/10295/UM060_0097.1